jgi:dCMP deaminase
MDRISIDQALLRTAHIMAERSTCLRKQVGAVIAVDTRIVSTGYAGSPSGLPHCIDVGCLIDPATGGCIRTQHAEANAIAFAARAGISVAQGTLYTTLAPCLPCAKLIVAAGISRVVYATDYRDSSGLEFLREAKVCAKRLIVHA